MDEIDEIVQEFLVESHENLDQLDRDLVALEREPDSRDLLGSIFRTIHTIKGTSGFLAFGSLESVTHVGENLLARLRDGKMSMTPATTDALLAMVDTVRDLLAAIEADGSEGDVDVTAVVRTISGLLDGPAAPDDEPVPAPAVAEPVAEPVATERTTPVVETERERTAEFEGNRVATPPAETVEAPAVEHEATPVSGEGATRVHTHRTP